MWMLSLGVAKFTSLLVTNKETNTCEIEREAEEAGKEMKSLLEDRRVCLSIKQEHNADNI